MDWPIERLDVMNTAFAGGLFCVYVAPPSLQALKQRLSRDGRDPDGKRFDKAKRELMNYWSNNIEIPFDLEVESTENQISTIARKIYRHYRQSL